MMGKGELLCVPNTWCQALKHALAQDLRLCCDLHLQLGRCLIHQVDGLVRQETVCGSSKARTM